MAGILRAMLRHATVCLALLLGTGLLGCPQQARTQAPTGSGGRGERTETRVTTPQPEDRGTPAASIGDVATGVALELPDGWTARAGRGDVVASAWGPGEDAVRVQLRTWDGDEDSLRPLLDRDPWSWSAAGPYAEIAVADGEPVVAAWREASGADPDREWIVFAWFFRVGDRGLGVLARVPVADVEAGWRTAVGILDGATRRSGA